MTYTILDREHLPRFQNTFEFEGSQQNTEVSFIWVDMPPGDSIRLHKHPYQEVFIIQEGTAAFTVGEAILEVYGGQILIVPPEVPHAFTNSGGGPLRQIDIHMARKIITEWLED